MKWILLASLLFVGCASKQYHMKNCRVILNTDGVDEGEKSCQRQSIWWD